MTAIDHLVYGVPELDAGIDRIERLVGARPVIGGRHPAWGTRNALLALGTACYLEVIAPDRELPEPERGIGLGLRGLRTPRLVTWALRCRDFAAASRAADLGPVETGGRERADGSILSWRLSGPHAGRMGGVLPFLIEWGDSPHPAATAPPGGDLLELRLSHPSPGEVRTALRRLGVEGMPPGPQVTVERGDAPRLAAMIRTATGIVELH